MTTKPPRWSPPKEDPTPPKAIEGLYALKALLEKELQDTVVQLDDIVRRRDLLRKRAGRGES